MEMTTVEPMISREQEQRLYAFLRRQTEGDALRYEVIAKKIQRAADGTESQWDRTIVQDWLTAMLESEVQAQARNPTTHAPQQPFAQVRTGSVQNPNYQAFLDTLEHEDLESLNSNGPFIAWMCQLRMKLPAGVVFDAAYVRQCADAQLSKRVKVQTQHKGRTSP
jgi:hypothetical protein